MTKQEGQNGEGTKKIPASNWWNITPPFGKRIVADAMLYLARSAAVHHILDHE